MTAAQCPHPTATETRRVCCHLLETKDGDYCKRFTGKGLEYDLLCFHCGKEPEASEAHLRRACLQCLQEIEEEAFWDSVEGEPQILERSSSLVFRHDVVRFAPMTIGTLLDIIPIESSSQSLWVALDKSGQIISIDLTNQVVTPLAEVSQSDVSLEDKVSLHVDRSGSFAAVANTHGQHGVVVNLNTGSVTMRLSRDNYHIIHSIFPIAFCEIKGRLLLIHGTAWNRLDISDPYSGRLITDRSLTPYRKGDPRPEHYLDYFHSELVVSPNQEWIADNGWIWSPAGGVMSWNLRRWVEENVWESEDGPSKRPLCARWYYWDGSLCWMGDQTLAVCGYGPHLESLIPAAWLFDAESGDELRWFAGPTGSLVFDTYLFSLSKEHGTSVWDAATGERLLLDPAFSPTRYHRGTQQFLTLLPADTFQLSRLQELHP